jgi:hypothetical protein
MLVASLPGIRRGSGPVPVTADVRQKNIAFLDSSFPFFISALN